jgi:arabinofuranosyltransferase
VTDAAPPVRRTTTLLHVAGIAAILALAVAVTKDAWLSDDAFITLRTIDNVWSGYGLRWNPIERVQTYTHPLWMLLLAAVYGVTREPHLTTLAISLAVTASAVWLLARRLTPAGRALAFVPLAGSRAFVDYSTSGLESPLSHLLLAAFWLLVLAEAPPSRRRLLTLATLASLCLLTRLDLALLVAPGLVVEIVRGWRTRRSDVAPALALGALPLVLWHAFALVYYGFLFPNTAYAKLGTGLPSSELMAQGLRYLQESFVNDPVTLLIIAAGALVGVWRPTPQTAALSGAITMSVAYVVRAGGDFMSGRFLTPAFLCAVVLLATRLPARWPRVVPGAVVAALIVGLVPSTSPLRMGTPFVPPGQVRVGHGIVDERSVYYPATGFVPVLRGVRYTSFMWAHETMPVPIVWKVGAIGILGFTSGPALHAVDPLALADPLLARLPVTPGTTWRIGHFERDLPEGYEDTLKGCLSRVFPRAAVRPPTSSCLPYWDEANRFTDPRIAGAYRELMLITQGPLLDRSRAAAIVRWNTGGSPLAR